MSKSGPLKGRNRPKTAIQPSRRERRLSDHKAVVQLLQSVRQLIANSGERQDKLAKDRR